MRSPAHLAQVPNVTRVDGWSRPQTGVAGLARIPLTRTYPDQGHGGVSLVTVSASSLVEQLKLLEGRWLQPGETGAAVLNQITRDTMVPNARAGDSVQLFIAGQPTT
jgi:putative ABC transport system permease protein